MERRASLISKHHKEEIIGPIFDEFGWSLETVWADTDQLGTFSGDIPRRQSPIETVRRKALLGTHHTDAPWLVASEGTIRTSFTGLVEGIEIVALVPRGTGTMVT
ncbi:MAG: hypothetical protein KGL79_06625, partial [Acidobacteriota bacterium]|nr:hypothetical protein [Acidobacteriota bacterium]